jgi:putative hydrolase of the HAD superfamily
MNVLFDDIDYKNIKYIGFDLDGTLYDEFDFIKQVYDEINNELLKDAQSHDYMLNRWLEKGSSYNKIYDEVYNKFEYMNYESKGDFINNALSIFRNFSPCLELNSRNKYFLDYFSNNYILFLVTDGNPILQKKKFLNLGLDKYFKKDNIVFTGEYGENYEKPHSKSIELLSHIECDHAIFVGDRDVDEKFALSLGIRFLKVYNLIKVQ